MDSEIKKLHKKVYRAMIFQYHNYDTLRKFEIWFYISTIFISIMLLASNDLTNYLKAISIFDLKIPLKVIEFIFFAINLILVATSISWIYISTKYNIPDIGLIAEKLKNIQCDIEVSENLKEATDHFNKYQDVKPNINDLLFTNTKSINKKLKESGKPEYCFDDK